MEHTTVLYTLVGILFAILAISPPLIGQDTPHGGMRILMFPLILFTVYGLFQGLFIFTTATMTPGNMETNVFAMSSNLLVVKAAIASGVLVILLDMFRYGGFASYCNNVFFAAPSDWAAYQSNKDLIRDYRISPRSAILKAKFVMLLGMALASSLLLLVIPGFWPLSIFLILSGMVAVDVSTLSVRLLGTPDVDMTFDTDYLKRLTRNRSKYLLVLAVPRIPTALLALKRKA